MQRVTDQRKLPRDGQQCCYPPDGFTCPLCKHQEAPGEGRGKEKGESVTTVRTGRSNVRNQAAAFKGDVIRQGKGRPTVAAEDLRPVLC